MLTNIGDFLMVRSYYPSDCHVNYFDFERIEALKHAIGAYGICPILQSPTPASPHQMHKNNKHSEEVDILRWCTDIETSKLSSVDGKRLNRACFAIKHLWTLMFECANPEPNPPHGEKGDFRKVTVTLPPRAFEQLVREAAKRKIA